MSEQLAVRIEYCPKWRGIWLTDGRLDKLMEKSGSSHDPREKNQRCKDDNDDERGVGGFLRGIFD